MVSRSDLSRMSTRIALTAVGLGAIAWAGVVLAAPTTRGLDRVADRIVVGDAFKPDDLRRIAVDLEEASRTPQIRASALRNAVIVAVRQAEEAIAEGRRTEIDERLEALGPMLDRALVAAPGDGFLWLVRFWHGNLRSGFDARNLDLLAASYRAAPREGWIAVRRTSVALAAISRMEEPLRGAVVDEFVGLVNSRLGPMADIFVTSGWPARDTLLPALAAASEVNRQNFARAVYQRGYDIEVPGIARSDARPWSR
ncbi:hypothetical protein [Rhodoplanes sp. SY1]|uniref:hypothetical protein n=1 Tax=Rhodoplanes sp. SY1 TaxID=3166646 RepID=UPI0038B49821